MYEPNGADQPAHRVPHARRWSSFELLLIAVAVWVTLMALAFVAFFLFVGGN